MLQVRLQTRAMRAGMKRTSGGRWMSGVSPRERLPAGAPAPSVPGVLRTVARPRRAELSSSRREAAVRSSTVVEKLATIPASRRSETRSSGSARGPVRISGVPRRSPSAASASTGSWSVATMSFWAGPVRASGERRGAPSGCVSRPVVLRVVLLGCLSAPRLGDRRCRFRCGGDALVLTSARMRARLSRRQRAVPCVQLPRWLVLLLQYVSVWRHERVGPGLLQ
jgi:hypothetical protein